MKIAHPILSLAIKTALCHCPNAPEERQQCPRLRPTHLNPAFMPLTKKNGPQRSRNKNYGLGNIKGKWNAGKESSGVPSEVPTAPNFLQTLDSPLTWQRCSEVKVLSSRGFQDPLGLKSLIHAQPTAITLDPLSRPEEGKKWGWKVVAFQLSLFHSGPT